LEKLLYRRIAADLRRRIGAGRLPQGFRLPSSRSLARQLGVSRNTVIAAYDLLIDEGLLSAREGSGTRVNAVRRAPLDPRNLLREAGYPESILPLHDPDGNLLHLHVRC
jgi:GntR family transcriptional regulator/MocR family aminotransferase